MRLGSFLLLGSTLVLAGMAAGGCTPLRSHQGYVVDVDLVNSVQPGVDNRESVLAVLGTPTFTSQFNQGDWYYVARDSRNLAFNNPHPVNQNTIAISFDDSGTVSAIRRIGMDQVVSIDPMDKTTPTLGRERSFFDELFGNIGSVGAPGMAGQSGGGRDVP